MSPLAMNPEERRDMDALVAAALAEDLGAGDVTADSIVPPDAQASARIVARAPGILAGIEAAAAVFAAAGGGLSFIARCSDGQSVVPGSVLALVEGDARAMLRGERTALNFLQHLSGIASLTRRFVDAAGGRAEILDTRKTVPGLRRLAKFAVRAGGGRNHRTGLFDQVLIKENHLAAGKLTAGEAVRKARAAAPAGVIVEVEVENLDQFKDALEAEPDVIMLDDMSGEDARTAVEIRGNREGVLIEISGGVRLDNVGAVAATGVDRISVGRITHSAPALDIAMEFEWK